MRVLIVRLGALGDILHAAPVVAALRASRPEVRIDWVVDARHRAIAELLDGIDHLIVWSGPKMTGSEGLWSTLSALRAARYDLALDLQGLIKSALLARLSGAARVVGFAAASLREPAARVFYSETVTPNDGGHVVEKNLSVLPPLGVAAMARPVRFKPVSSPTIERFVTESFVGRPFAVLNPGAGWPNKQWPVERFGALARWLRDGPGLASCVTFGPQERALAARVVDASEHAAVIAPPTSIPDYVALVRRASLVVAGDTGPMHIAAAVGTRVVGIFGPTSSVRNGAFGMPPSSQVSRYDTCACHYARRCTRASQCVDDIEVAEVRAAVAVALEDGGTRG